MNSNTLTGKRFVLLPNYINLTRQGLHYRDLLTYITIRSFNNTTYDLCKPSYDTICKRSGMSKKFISASIKRLKCSGFLKVKISPKKRISNEYAFKKVEAFSRIPYDIFEMAELTSSEKAMLIALRQFFTDTLECMGGGITNMAMMLDIKYKALYTQYKSLIKKGYISEVVKPGRKKSTVRLTSKVNWICNDIKPIDTNVDSPLFIYL